MLNHNLTRHLGCAPCPCCGGQGYRYDSGPSIWLGITPPPVRAVRCGNCNGTGYLQIQPTPINDLRPMCSYDAKLGARA